jgi:hypothetical protein
MCRVKPPRRIHSRSQPHRMASKAGQLFIAASTSRLSRPHRCQEGVTASVNHSGAAHIRGGAGADQTSRHSSRRCYAGNGPTGCQDRVKIRSTGVRITSRSPRSPEGRLDAAGNLSRPQSPPHSGDCPGTGRKGHISPFDRLRSGDDLDFLVAGADLYPRPLSYEQRRHSSTQSGPTRH